VALAEDERKGFVKAAKSAIEELPSIFKFVLDVLAGFGVFTVIFGVTAAIHLLNEMAVSGGFASQQITGLGVLEDVLFWLDIVGFGVYLVCRSGVHFVAFCMSASKSGVEEWTKRK
jgi:hypothetical protein